MTPQSFEITRCSLSDPPSDFGHSVTTPAACTAPPAALLPAPTTPPSPLAFASVFASVFASPGF